MVRFNLNNKKLNMSKIIKKNINILDPQWVGIGPSSNRDVIQFSQLMTNKVWQPTLPAYHANPFMV